MSSFAMLPTGLLPKAYLASLLHPVSLRHQDSSLFPKASRRHLHLVQICLAYQVSLMAHHQVFLGWDHPHRGRANLLVFAGVLRCRVSKKASRWNKPEATSDMLDRVSNKATRLRANVAR